ncbi:MAG: GHKL domain-containing protein, partial [Gammaproteobacteria bacterium]|nr:GHKL domain-containing protein [Gammaproteobacteria bacterium]
QLKSLARKPGKDLYAVDLTQVVENVLVLLDRSIKSCGATIEILIEPDCQKVMAGQLRLEQVVLNLLTNALHAVADEPEKVIVIQASAQQNRIELSIGDSGAGITGEHHDKVFDPFFTTKEIGEGLGLGLTISYNIIKDLGGSLTLDTSQGKGTTFRISLIGA